MADMDGEAAFLASMGGDAAYDPAYQQPQTEQDDEEEEDDEDYDPSSFMPNPPEVASATPQPQLSQPPSQVPSRTASRLSNPVNAPTPPPAPQAAQKPKTIGGFIEEDDDDESGEENNVSHGTNGAVAVASPIPQQQSVTHTPAQANVHIYNPPKDSGTPDVVANGAADPVSNLPAPSSLSHNGALPVEAKPNAPLTTAQAAVPKPRLPQDRVGQLEDRVKDDPKGDINAWMELIAHHRSKNRLDDARRVYERFFEVFPTAAEQWVSYATLELEQDDLAKLEAIFHASLLKNPNVQLWTIYLDHIRRRNNIMTDANGSARQVISQVYDFVLNTVGIDKDSGKIWQDYIDFIKSGPGTPGGSGWQDAQKMDLLRKAYQRAICVPMQAVSTLWKEYDSFEMGLNKMTGRKFLQERSPAYMTARSSYTALQNITKDLKRTTIPSLPPAPGCDGEEEFMYQVQIWQRWVEWEKEDPLVLKDEDLKAYRDRIIYVYKHAVTALRFWPQVWYDAADYCFENGMDAEGTDFLVQGAAANPESCLLAFRRADRLEQTTPAEEGEESLKRRGDAVKEPYNNVLNALYGLIDKAKEREPRAIVQIQEHFASLPPLSRDVTPEARDDDDEEHPPARNPREAEEKMQIDAVQQGTKAQINILSKLLSFVWVALMRSMRRIQGKGKPDAPIGGMRNVFAEARKRGRITSDVYVATALLEYHCYKDPASTKIFERGMKLFPEDELFALEYLKHLIATNDVTNARAVFETTVSKLSAKPEGILKAKPLYLFFHEYESQYGELAQIAKLEKRMADLYPDDPSLSLFAHRFKTTTFDPCAVRPIISPGSQMRPKLFGAMPSIEQIPIPQPPRVVQAPVSGYVQSPKRAFDGANDSETEQPARKLLRGESPLKGAAGRRQQQRQRAEGYGSQTIGGVRGGPEPPKPLPREITMLLGVIPGASAYREVRLDPERMVGLIRGLDLSRARTQQGAYPSYGYGR